MVTCGPDDTLFEQENPKYQTVRAVARFGNNERSQKLLVYGSQSQIDQVEAVLDDIRQARIQDTVDVALIRRLETSERDQITDLMNDRGFDYF
jgi:hypothetical protein